MMCDTARTDETAEVRADTLVAARLDASVAKTGPEEPTTILAIDDDPGDAEILRRSLEEIPGLRFEFIHCTNAETARAEMSRRRADMVFLDYRLQGQTGQEVVEQMRSSGLLAPIIALTGHGDEYVAAGLIRCGADDYIVKGDLHPQLLRRAMDNARAQCLRRETQARNRQLVTQLRAAKESLEERNHRLHELYRTAHQFVDNVSHEFRTPLTVIKEFTSIVRDGLAGEVNDEQREYLDIVSNRTDDLAIMVDDMLDLSRLETGILGVCRRNCRVDEIVEHVRTTLQRKASARAISLEIAVDDGLPAVYCDPEKIGRVVINLVVNALKFSDEGGHVRLWVHEDAREAQVIFGVTDNGPGIAPQSVQAIFERFKQIEGPTRTSTKGFGLGLNIAMELVRLNFGDIAVESELGEGSTFSFTVPTADPQRLLARYLERVEGFRSDSAYVSLLCAAVEPTTDAELLEDVEHCLQHQIRRSDLLFRNGSNVWLLVLATHQEELGHMINRVGNAWIQFNRNRPGKPLPEIDFEVIGIWRADTQSGDFIKRFIALRGEADRCGADTMVHSPVTAAAARMP